VRRASAISLVAAICFSLIAPLLLADPESNLPACCRRAGSHHCAMAGDESAGSLGLQAVHEKCPLFPLSTAAQFRAGAASLEDSPGIFAGLVSHPSVQPQTEARARVSFNRSRQKRGPPDSLLLNL
jgi:hypothetical protein